MEETREERCPIYFHKDLKKSCCVSSYAILVSAAITFYDITPGSLRTNPVHRLIILPRTIPSFPPALHTTRTLHTTRESCTRRERVCQSGFKSGFIKVLLIRSRHGHGGELLDMVVVAHAAHDVVLQRGHRRPQLHDVAVQVAFEKANFETGFSLYRL
jgi:hypothetical protein